VITVDTTGFKAMAADLSRMGGVPIQQVILSETARVLERCIQLTPRRTPERIRTTVEYRNRNLWSNGDPANWRRRGDPVISITKKGTIFFVDHSSYVPGRGRTAPRGKRIGAKTFHDMNGFFRWSNERWGRYQLLLEDMKNKIIDVAKAVRASGLAKQSWLQIAYQLGLGEQVSAPDYVRRARPSNGKVYVNGTARKFESATEFYVEIMNDNPIVAGRFNGAAILQRAINGRLAYFDTNLAKGVFNDLRMRATRYKGVFVS
jgi:hypothetical protein